jgi:chemotaxis protein CheX
MASQDLAGNLIISFDKESISGIVSGMLGEEVSGITPDVVDAVGELTNMICGGAKAILGERGYKFDMATPVMLVGENLELCQFSKSPVITIPFKVDCGEFVVEANLYPKTRQ